MNSKLFLLSETYNEHVIRLFQEIITNNLCSRLKSVETVFFENKNVSYSKNIFPINSKDKIYTALNLNLRFFSYRFEIFYSLKRNGLSFSFKVPFLYNKCFLILCNNVILPVIEGKLDRSSYGFRPFRDCKDLFFEINQLFKKSKSFLWVLKSKLSFSIFNTSWLIKNFPFNKNLLNLMLTKTADNFDLKENVIFFSTLFNFLLSGLV